LQSREVPVVPARKRRGFLGRSHPHSIAAPVLVPVFVGITVFESDDTHLARTTCLGTVESPSD
jgi:hypothetical protein